ncbi:MAG: endonuclease/exonuclease/phosphatase family protein [Candidatus Hydrogenedentes bacterium]|nr:endonuclease/exonuclease/phosphatase family protein [Candidatus Hydrogenedentota bacterium]
MLRLLLSFLLLPILAGAATPLKIMSFNVRYGTANDGPNHWDKRKGIVTGAIKAYDPDVVGTQECLDFQAEYIVDELPEYRWFGVGREINCGGEHMAVLYKHKSLAPIESGNFWLSDTPGVVGSVSWDSACRRMVTWAKFQHLESKQSFYFLNTHLDHKSEPARQGGAKVLRDWIAALPADAPIILTGDFNSVAGNSEAYTILTAAGLNDAWTSAVERAGPAITWSGFKAPEEGQDRRIDWILARGPIDVTRCETVTFNQKGRYPSDHFPVFGLLSIK